MRTEEEKWNLLSKLVADAIGVGEILKESSNYEYDIKLTKQNEKIGEDGVREFDVNINFYAKPKKGIEFIENKITILKTGDIISW